MQTDLVAKAMDRGNKFTLGIRCLNHFEQAAAIAEWPQLFVEGILANAESRLHKLL